MSGSRIDPGGDIYREARQNVASTAAFLATAKGLPGVNCDAIACSIVHFMEPRALHLLVHARDTRVTENIHDQIAHLIDYQATYAILDLFAHAGGARLDLFPPGMVGSVAEKILQRVKGEAGSGATPARTLTYVWPAPAVAEYWAHAHLAKRRSAEAQTADLAKVEAAILSLIAEHP